MPSQPRGGFIAVEELERDHGAAPPWPAYCWMKAAERFVGGDHHVDSQSLSDQPIDKVQESRQTLTSPLLRVGRKQFVAVLEHEEARLRDRLLLLVIVVSVETDIDE